MKFIDKIIQNKKRLTTGFAFGFLALFCVIAGGVPILLLVFAICFLGAKEYVAILKHKGFLPSFHIITLTIIALLFLVGIQEYDWVQMAFVLSTLAAFCTVLFKGKQPYIVNVATTVLGSIYCGWLPIHFVLLRQLNCCDISLFSISNNDGLGFLLFTFFTVVATDVGGFYFGSKFGKTKLAPVISPKKTREGAIGASSFAVLIGVLCGLFIGITMFQSILGALLITTAAQLGDLSESLIKRDAGVKDSGNTLPGHGGFLDRSDSFIFAAPVAFYYFKFFVLNNNFWRYFIYIFK